MRHQPLLRVQDDRTLTHFRGNAKGYGDLETSLADTYKYIFTIWPNNHNTWHLLKWKENLCSHKNMCANVYSRFIHNQQKVKTIKMSFNRCTRKLCCIHTMEWYDVAILWTHLATWMNFLMHFSKWKKPNIKAVIFYDCIYAMMKKAKL